ncbi:MAG TPA: ATP-binding protein [Anaeromyxobacteraceae bacterium]
MPQPLEDRLAAAQRTIAALMRRVELQVSSGESAFSVLEQNIALERVVGEKTRKLEEQRRELQEALDTLRRTQTELLQAQKLESVGRFAAGIAHEINTPIQYIGDNTRFLEEAFSSLAELLRLRQEAIDASPVPPEVRKQLAEAAERVELSYLLEQGPKSIARSLEGVQRVATIVRAMKEFAHPDQKEPVSTDLNRALLATLEVARSEYKYVADVVTDCGEIPPVTCRPGDLNQVFLNIIVNAAHAIEDVVAGSQRKGTIRVETRREGEDVIVAISDSGGGIPEASREKIFDPFFTTKPVGRGTGQGLAISRSIVLNHGGSLTFATRLGEGTTFFVRIPIDPPTAPPASVC